MKLRTVLLTAATLAALGTLTPATAGPDTFGANGKAWVDMTGEEGYPDGTWMNRNNPRNNKNWNLGGFSVPGMMDEHVRPDLKSDGHSAIEWFDEGGEAGMVVAPPGLAPAVPD